MATNGYFNGFSWFQWFCDKSLIVKKAWKLYAIIRCPEAEKPSGLTWFWEGKMASLCKLDHVKLEPTLFAALIPVAAC